MKKIKSLAQLMRTLHDRNSCIGFLEECRWQSIPICPHCKCQSERHYRLKTKGEFNGLYKCKYCRKTFTVTTGTIFEGTKVPLEDWFYAIHVFLGHKKGISSVQLSKDIGVTQKTAYYMLTKIRCNLREPFILNSLDGVIQIDETYVGGKTKGRFWQNQGRSTKQKTPVVGLLNDDKVITFVVNDTECNTLQGIIYAIVKFGSTIVTDGWHGYRGINKHYRHQVVIHSKGNYVNKEGFHTNGIEGYWSQLKRGIKGTYHSVSRKCLEKYCDEYAHRYSTRKITDFERFAQFISANHLKLKYYDLTYKQIKR